MEITNINEKNVEQQLQQIVGDLDYGSKLPSLRKLSESIGVSVPVVDRYLSKMAAAGQILIKPRSGAYKAMPIRRRLELLSMTAYLFNGDYNFQYYFVSSLVTRLVCAERQVRLFDLSRDCSPVRLGGIGNPGNSLIITYNVRQEQFRIIDFLAERGVPMLHILPNYLCELTPAIKIDDYALVKEQIEFLLDSGYRRIAYFHAVDKDTAGKTENYSRAWTERLKAFYRCAVELNLDLSPEYICNVGPWGEQIGEAVSKLFAMKQPPEAIIIYDHHARPLYQELRRRNLEPGRDIAVLGTDDMPWNQMMTPALSSTKICLDSMFSQVEKAIEELEAGRSYGTSYLEIKRIKRETT